MDSHYANQNSFYRITVAIFFVAIFVIATGVHYSGNVSDPKEPKANVARLDSNEIRNRSTISRSSSSRHLDSSSSPKSKTSRSISTTGSSVFAKPGSVFSRLVQQEDYFYEPRRRRFRYDDVENPEEIKFEGYNRRGIPNWTSNPKFKYDEFRFVRVKYDSYGRTRWGQKWRIDYPDSDLNFSFRLQQLTSLKVNPNPIFLELTDPRIFDYPFMYLIEPGDIYFTMEEAKAMRRYLNNGGFIMVDDFWGDLEWYDFEEVMKMVFPDRTYEELEIDHPIFHCVYDLKTKPQCPAIGMYERTGQTTDRPYDPTARDVHYRAYYDDNDRMCMIACFNTDLGDGWEREGESEFYFKRFSEKEAYPMGINIVVYAMTH